VRYPCTSDLCMG